MSTTLWVGHLSKLIHQDDLYGLFQPIGDIVSLNLISPRGCAFLCMNRRQDAARIMNKFQGERLQGKPMTVIIFYLQSFIIGWLGNNVDFKFFK